MILLKLKISIFLLGLYFVVFFWSVGFANEVPEDRSIYVFAPFYFDFGDQGEDVLSNLLHGQHNYQYCDEKEISSPSPSPSVTSLSGFISQLSNPNGIVLIDSHGSEIPATFGWLFTETFEYSSAGEVACDNKIAEYISKGVSAAEIARGEIDGIGAQSGKRFYAIKISPNYISNHTSQMGNKSIVFGNFCYSDSLKDAFINGGKVYNYFGFDKSVTLSRGAFLREYIIQAIRWTNRR